MSVTTESLAETAWAFFDACDTGGGWERCRAYCRPDATFSSQAEPLAELSTLQEYTDWMKDMMALLPDGAYEVRSFAADPTRDNVCVYGVFTGTHTGEGGPVAPTGMSASTDYVYVMDFDDGRISHMTKIWNAGWALRQLGWAG